MQETEDRTQDYYRKQLQPVIHSFKTLSDPSLQTAVPLLSTAAAEAGVAISSPLHPLVDGSGVGSKAQEEAQTACHAAVGHHGNHNKWRHKDKAKNDEGRGAVIIQDSFTVVCIRMYNLQIKYKKSYSNSHR